jgi:hypothetical protein
VRRAGPAGIAQQVWIAGLGLRQQLRAVHVRQAQIGHQRVVGTGLEFRQRRRTTAGPVDIPAQLQRQQALLQGGERGRMPLDNENLNHKSHSVARLRRG